MTPRFSPTSPVLHQASEQTFPAVSKGGPINCPLQWSCSSPSFTCPSEPPGSARLTWWGRWARGPRCTAEPKRALTVPAPHPRSSGCGERKRTGQLFISDLLDQEIKQTAVRGERLRYRSPPMSSLSWWSQDISALKLHFSTSSPAMKVWTKGSMIFPSWCHASEEMLHSGHQKTHKPTWEDLKNTSRPATLNHKTFLAAGFLICFKKLKIKTRGWRSHDLQHDTYFWVLQAF